MHGREVWRHCKPCDHFWKPPGDDWTCMFCGEPGLVSFHGPMLASAHESPTTERVEMTVAEWADQQPVSQRVRHWVDGIPCHDQPVSRRPL